MPRAEPSARASRVLGAPPSATSTAGPPSVCCQQHPMLWQRAPPLQRAPPCSVHPLAACISLQHASPCSVDLPIACTCPLQPAHPPASACTHPPAACTHPPAACNPPSACTPPQPAPTPPACTPPQPLHGPGAQQRKPSWCLLPRIRLHNPFPLARRGFCSVNARWPAAPGAGGLLACRGCWGGQRGGDAGQGQPPHAPPGPGCPYPPCACHPVPPALCTLAHRAAPSQHDASPAPLSCAPPGAGSTHVPSPGAWTGPISRRRDAVAGF